MSDFKATNDFIFIKRDETKKEAGVLKLTSAGQVKPHQGTIISVGELVEDKKIKPQKTAIWHSTVGFTIAIDGEDYLVLTGREVIAVK